MPANIPVIVAAWNSPAELRAMADFVCTGTNDELVIQQALNLTRPVKLINGQYKIYNTVYGKPLASLELEQGAQWKLMADVDALYIAKNFSFRGGSMIVDGSVDFTRAFILLDGKEKYGVSADMRFGVTGVFDTTLRGYLAKESGVGIRFVADSPDDWSYATGLRFENITLYGFFDAIRLELPAEPRPKPHFFNGNFFSGLYIDGCFYGINMVNSPCGGNTFTNIQVQARQMSRRALVVDGSGNQFTNVQVWDWPYLPVIEIARLAEKNCIFGSLCHRAVLDLSDRKDSLIHDVYAQTATNLNTLHNASVVYTWP